MKRANAHFSDDLLSSLLNEPIPGQGVFWSSVGGKPYPVSIRALLFEDIYKAADPTYSREAVPTFAEDLRQATATLAQQALAARLQSTGASDETPGSGSASGAAPADLFGEPADEGQPDLEVYYRQSAVSALKESEDVMNRLNEDGAAWGHLVKVIEEALPGTLDNRNRKAYELVRLTIEALFGSEGEGWHTFKHDVTRKTYVRRGPGERD